MKRMSSLALLTSLTATPKSAQNRTKGELSRSGTTTSDAAPNDLTNFEQTFTHHTATVNGVRLHYVMGGKGDPVVLLHGWPTSWYEWRHIMPTLAQRYTVIAPDMRGLGDSQRPTTGYDKRTLAEDIYQLVRQLGCQRIFLVGHDLGGQVAYAYASAHPQDVLKLAILEVPIPGLEGWEEAKQRLWHFAFHAVRDLPEALIAGREQIYLSWFYQDSAYNPAAITEAQIDEYVRIYSAPGALRAGFEYYRAFPEDVRQNREYAKTKLQMPVLALGGETSLKDFPLRQLQAVASDVRGSVIERCGHWIPDERPDYLTQQLLAFFSEEKG